MLIKIHLVWVEKEVLLFMLSIMTPMNLKYLTNSNLLIVLILQLLMIGLEDPVTWLMLTLSSQIKHKHIVWSSLSWEMVSLLSISSMSRTEDQYKFSKLNLLTYLNNFSSYTFLFPTLPSLLLFLLTRNTMILPSDIGKHKSLLLQAISIHSRLIYILIKLEL